MSRKAPQNRGFTLIEVLVVVAIIALLISILLPSLAAAKEQAKNVACQANLKSIATAMIAWSSEHKGKLPGSRNQTDSAENDRPVTWLGPYQPDLGLPQQPSTGVLWRHMGREAKAYICPTDSATRRDTGIKVTHSYTFHAILGGASTEWLAGGHYLKKAPFNENDHTGTNVPMVPFDGVPMVIEEDFKYNNAQPGDLFDGAWASKDGFADRHFYRNGKGSANLAFTDSHVGKIEAPHGDLSHPSGTPTDSFLQAEDVCIRTTRGRWISGSNWDGDGQLKSNYGKLLSSATEGSKVHPGVNH